VNSSPGQKPVNEESYCSNSFQDYGTCWNLMALTDLENPPAIDQQPAMLSQHDGISSLAEE